MYQRLTESKSAAVPVRQSPEQTPFDPASQSVSTRPLRLGPTSDPYERQADQAAAALLDQRLTDELLASLKRPRQPAAPDLVLRRPLNLGTGPVIGQSELDPATCQAIRQEQAAHGETLPVSVRRQMEAALGGDFSAVHLHTGPAAEALNQRLGSRAFTTGGHLFFRRGEYAPHSPAGQATLAHELAHVRQQSPQSQLVQRLVPSDRAWERSIDKTFYKRSTELDAITAALAAYNAARANTETSDSQLVHHLTRIQDAIHAWYATKLLDANEQYAGKSGRAKHIAALLSEVEDERLDLEGKHQADLDKDSSPIGEYNRLAVFSAGAMLEGSGAFSGESVSEYDAARERLLQEQQTATEVDIRIEMLSARAREAHRQMQSELSKLPDASGVVGLFTAPEFYFKRPGIPFSQADMLQISNAFQSLSASLPGMVIVPGSIVYRSRQDDQTAIQNIAMAFMNGKRLKELRKRKEGMDILSYYRRDNEFRRGDEDRRMQEWRQGGGVGSEIDLHDPTGQSGISVAGESSSFKVGNLTFSMELCADHFAARAMHDLVTRHKKDRATEGAHVQILISAGATLSPKGLALREGGLFVHNDAGELDANAGGMRRVYTDTSATSPAPKTQINARTQLQRMFMGIYDLPTSINDDD